MQLSNKNIEIHIDEKNGFTTAIFNPTDEHSMNWILENSKWGAVNGFETKNIVFSENKASIFRERDNLQLVIEKEITDKGYFETYSITNVSELEFFLTKENFGIFFPYQCNYSPEKDILNQTCINHIWCGKSVCWIYSKKTNGKPPYLVMNMTEGAIDDYSISYDISRTKNASFYRGEIVLHPCEQIIMPHNTVKYKFFYQFNTETPDNYLPGFEDAIRFYADKYTLNTNESLNFCLETRKEYENIHIYCEDNELKYEKNNNHIFGSCTFETEGEKTLTAILDEKETLIRVNVIAKTDEILKKRVDFIVNKQQYNCDGSHLDGAYLIYDNETKSVYCDNSVYRDHNSARERIGMGVIVCKALQKKYDKKIMKSLRNHREFIEREIFDKASGYVCDDVLKNDNPNRIFNLPWLSVYYLEWYNLTGEKDCIDNAANILIKFFETAGNHSGQCVEAVKICDALRKESLTALENTLKKTFLKYADNILKKCDTILECSWCSEQPSNLLSYQSQAYILSGNSKYLENAKQCYLALKAFFGKQPDFHLNCIPVRYWDRYWFGKYRSYGDVFPHYWSALAGWAMSWYDEALKSSLHKEEISANLSGNMCIFKNDGFASNNYLYPYKITMYTSDPKYRNQYIKPCITYGKNYDIWANDQDWALYYATRFLN